MFKWDNEKSQEENNSGSLYNILIKTLQIGLDKSSPYPNMLFFLSV